MRQHPTEPLQIFMLNTVAYGTSSAPFLAIRCLKMLSDAVQISHPFVSEFIKKDFFVDDQLTGADSFETFAKLQKDIPYLLSSAGFKLANWFSNHPDLRIAKST